MKVPSIKLVCFAAFSLAANALFLASSAHAQNEGQEAWSQQYRVQYEVPRGNYTGRSPYMSGGVQAEPAAPVVTDEPAPAAAPKAKTTCSDPTWGLIRMSKTMPSEVNLGGEFVANLKITAAACAANVVVRDAIPAGATYIKSEPAATVDGNKLTWNLGDMDAGSTVDAKVTLRADKEGAIVNCATVSADPRVCATTFVGKPSLSIDKSGPATAKLGDNVTYNIVVKNTGNAIAKNVVVTDPVPEGYSHASGQAELSVNVGDIAPGQSKALTATFKANKRGKVCNVASAAGSNVSKVSDDACTIIQQPGLKIEKTGTKDQIIGRKADYEITVSNTGDTDLANVSVVDVAPEGTELVAASGASLSGNKATWTIANLKSGSKQSFSATVVGKQAGSLCNNASASAAGLNESAQACTTWKGVAGVLLEMVDNPDPIQVGETTTYTIKVTNQGFADIHNVKLSANYDDRILPVSSDKGVVSGQLVDFPNVPVITPKAAVTYKVVVKGSKAGDTRNKVTITHCDELQSTVSKEESTTVY